MVPKMRWKNFRGFADTGWLELRPLTVLIGPNNSGKSSIIAPLLLLKQTVEAAGRDSPLVSKGPIQDLGAYTDFVRGHDQSAEMFFGLRFHTHEDVEYKEDDLGDVPPGAIEVTVSLEDGRPTLQQFAVFDVYARRLFSRSRIDGKYTLEEFRIPPAKSKWDKKILEALKDAQPQNFLFTAGHVLRSALGEEGESEVLDKNPEMLEQAFLYSSITSFTNSMVMGFLSDMEFLGPLRAQPQRYYEVFGDAPSDVGTSGELAAAILYANRNDSKAVEKIDKWMRRFGFADRVQCTSLLDEVFKVELVSGTGTQSFASNLADCGFGVSQLFPILVQGLLGKNSTAFVCEQPEVHLNPKQQALLPELFAEIIEGGGRLVIETHSEHLLIALRRLVAERVFAPDEVSLYYVDGCAGTSNVRKVNISDNGHIPNDEWPEGFLTDGLQQAFALAEAQARRTTSG